MMRIPVGLTALALLALAGTSPAAGAPAAPNLIVNGDFEAPAPQNPPPGWTMWGASVYKVPEHFARDTANPHSGEACLRIQHPAGSGGYLVSSPETAVRPRQGMAYRVSFWARADKPGSSLFSFTAYETTNPFKDAGSPGSFPFPAGPEWQQYTFEVHEGWDFFAQSSAYVMLTFNAVTRESGADREARTLWVDDVVVTEAPSPRRGRLVDEATLKYPPLDHRLRPGERLEFTVDAAQRLRPAIRAAGGISFHRVCGWTGQPYDKQGQYTLHVEVEKAIRDLRLPLTRFYAVGDEPMGLEAAIDGAAEVCRRMAIPQESTVLEFETQGATSKLSPEVWARGVRHSLAKGYGFCYWEIANEPYLPRANAAFPTPESYIEHVKAVSRAVRAVHPAGQIGIGIHSRDAKWGNNVLKQAAGAYDFVAGHFYAGVSAIHTRKFEVAVLTENYRRLDDILKLNALLREYNPGRDVYQYDTEWGMHSSGPNGERADYVDRNANLWGTLHRAVRLIYYAREGMMRGASSWQMLSSLSGQGFGILSQQAPEQRLLLYWLYYYFNRHVGDHVLALDGTAPYYAPAPGEDPLVRPGEFPGPLTPVLATASADAKTLYMVIANGSWDRSIPCRANLRGFQAVGAEGISLSHNDPDAKPLLERKEDAVGALPVTVEAGQFTCTLPPRSVAFITVR